VTTLAPLILAAVLPAFSEAPEPTAFSGRVAGADGRPAAGVEVLVSGPPRLHGTRPVLARTRTDDGGRFRVPVPDEADASRAALPLAVWAHRPGHGVNAAGVSRQKPPAEGAVTVQLGPPAHLDVRVLGPGGAPVAGAVVVPLMLRIERGLPLASTFMPPDELAARLSARTDADGRGRVADVDPAAVMGVGVVAEGFGRQSAVPLADGSGAVTVRLAAAGRVRGRVVTDDPAAAGGLHVLAWTFPAALKPDDTVGEASVVTDAEGRFTIPAIAAGRLGVNVRPPEGSGLIGPRPPTDRAVEPGELTEVEIPLKKPAGLREVAGKVIDRRGEPVAGAVVFQSGDAPARTRTKTDARGRFRLPGVAKGRTFLFARADGYRFAGMTVAPGGAEVTLRVNRAGEPPEKPRATREPPLPRAEERALARKVLEPYAATVIKRGNDSEKVQVLEVLARTDPARVLELLDGKVLAEPYHVRMMRMRVATGLRDESPDEALAVIESIDDPGFRAMALTEASDALPASERGKKLDLLARAAVDAKGATDPALRLLMSAQVAERWLDLGESARGKALLRGLQADAEKMPNAAFAGYARGAFAEELAQVDLKAALALTATLTDPNEFVRHHGNIAHELAARDPAEAERVLAMVRDPSQRDLYAVPVVYRMARADLDRAQRIAGAIQNRALRGYGLGMAALGLAEADRRADAVKALDEALAALDQVSEVGGVGTSAMFSPAAVAAVLIPVAERVDPGRVTETFWRAVSLRLPGKPEPAGSVTGRAADIPLAAALARYDPGFARALLDPLVGPDAPASFRSEYRGLAFVAAALIDPGWAAGLVEALPDDPDLKAYGEKNQARLAVAKVLSRRGVNRWRYLTYQHLHLWVPDIEDIDPNL